MIPKRTLSLHSQLIELVHHMIGHDPPLRPPRPVDCQTLLLMSQIYEVIRL